MAHQVSYLDYGGYRYKVGDLIKLSPSHEYLYYAVTGTGRSNCPNISTETRKITAIWASDSNSSVSNPIVTAYYSGSYRYGGGAIRPEQIATGGSSGGGSGGSGGGSSGGGTTGGQQPTVHYVYYDANGGSGAPAKQSKIYGSILTLSNTIPTKPGSVFVVWNTNPNGSGTNFSPGQQYGLDKHLLLYAIWRSVTYTVTYNANGGSGAPSSQTKTHDVALTLSNVEPSRTGYSFLGWSTSSSGGVGYKPSATYNGNSDITLYAVWGAHTYTVTFDANGGTNAPAPQNKVHDQNLTLTTSVPTRSKYDFVGWGTSSSASTAVYMPGGIYKDNSQITLYAIWKLAYVSPTIYNLTADRCNSAGILQDDGVHAKVVFEWKTENPVTEITISYKQQSASSWTPVTVQASGTSGKVEMVIGGALSTEFNYDIKVTVSDVNSSTKVYTGVPYLNFIMDINASGKGVAFGKPSTADLFEVGIPAKYYDNLAIRNWDLDGHSDGRFDITTTTSSKKYKTFQLYPDEVIIEKSIKVNARGSSWYDARDNAALRNTYSSDNSFCASMSMKTPTGSFDVGTLGDTLYINHTTDTQHGNQDNTQDMRLRLEPDGDLYTKLGKVSINQTPNRVLWSGIWFMSNDAQSIHLSGKNCISQQNHGIVLVFSGYDQYSYQAKNSNFSFHFVPKNYVSDLGNTSGFSTVFPMNSNLYGVMCSKLLYISDSLIKGHPENEKSGTSATGIKYDGKQYVLRYVYGV